MLGDSSSRPRWGAVAAWLALICAVVTSRLIVAPELLYDWDAVNYARALADFDVAQHQPHAPGYPLFVLLLWLLAWIPGETGPFVALNALLTGAILLLLARLVRRHASAQVAWFAALAFAVCPQFWHQGAASTIYVAECFCSLLSASVAFDLASGRRRPAIAALLFGAVVALRPPALLTLGPMLAMALVLARPRLVIALRAIAVLALTMLAWLVPTVLLSGGWSAYRTASAALAAWQLDLGSAFGGAPLAQTLPRLRRLMMFTFDATNVLVALLVLCGLVLLVKRLRSTVGPATSEAAGTTAPSARQEALLIVAWVLPATVVYGLHHLPKSGYVLTLVPIVYLLTGWAVGAAVWPPGRPPRRALGAAAALLMALFLLVNVYGFLRAIPHALLVHRDAELPLPGKVLLTGDYGVYALRYRTYPQRRLLRLLRQSQAPDHAVLFLMGSHEQHRLASFYCPGCWLIATSVDHQAYLCDRPACAEQLTFGAFQRRVLRRPRRRTWGRRTRIVADETSVTLQRAGRALRLPIAGLSRLTVITACPPCAIERGAGLRPLPTAALGAGYRAQTFALTKR
jgi:hypothetical protein